MQPGSSPDELLLDVRDGADWKGLASVVPGSWYSIWYVIDRTDRDTFHLYLNDGTADATEADLLGRFSFRDGGAPSDVLDGFAARAHAAGNRSMHIDNLYIDKGLAGR